MSTEERKLLIVEDDIGLQKQLKWCFDSYETFFASTRSEAIAQLRRHEPQVVLQDLGLPPDPAGVEEGMHTLQETLSLAPHTKVIVVTGNHDRASALRAISAGAYDFYQKPLDTDTLKLIVTRAFHIYAIEQENRELREAQLTSSVAGLIATDEAMIRVCRTIERVANTRACVLLSGESGTGKELLARALHEQSTRRRGPFIAVHCEAIPESVLAGELFGVVHNTKRGAATPNPFEVAHDGTLFLDEVGALPAALQARLLRFLQVSTGAVLRDPDELVPDVRLVCATTSSLAEAVSRGSFRQDLLSLVSEVMIDVPPLRERPGAVGLLAHAILSKYRGLQRRPHRRFSNDALVAMEAHDWPGNVRELENRLKTAMIVAEGSTITASDLNLDDKLESGLLLNLKEVRKRAERQAIIQALALVDGNISRTAELLGVSRPTLYDMMDRYAIAAGRDSSAHEGS